MKRPTVSTFEPLMGGTGLAFQRQLEVRMLEEGEARYREQAAETIRRGDGASLRAGERLVNLWLDGLRARVTTDKADFRKGVQRRPLGEIGSFWAKLPAEVIATIALRQVVSACLRDPHGPTVTSVSWAIGRAIFAEVNARLMRRERGAGYLKDGEMGPPGPVTLSSIFRRRYKRANPHLLQWWVKKQTDAAQWERAACVLMGSELIRHLIEVAKVPLEGGGVADGIIEVKDFRPRKPGRRAKPHKYHLIRLTPASMEAVRDAHRIRGLQRPRFRPMIVAPMPWQTKAENGERYVEGGYLTIRTSLVSKMHPAQRRRIHAADLTREFEAFDAAQATPLRVNRWLLGVVREIWASGGNLGGLPPTENPDRPEPLPDGADEKARRRQSKKLEAWHRRCIELEGLRKSFHEAADDAAWMDRLRDAGHESFWWPLQDDYRGRVYPLAPHLSYPGNDFRRGMLELAWSVPANNERALWWLKVNAASLYGQDKLSFDERVEWADDHMEKMVACARDPMMEDFWLFADKGDAPFRFLAACKALEDPEAAAHAPVQADGTCNVLQHYAGMTRDPEIARLVNLCGSSTDERPNDAYRVVVQPVGEIVARDAAAGIAEAIALAGLIDRDLLKQPFMTTFYSVTEAGMEGQLERKLKKRGMDERLAADCARYLKKIVPQAMSRSFAPALRVLDYYKAGAKLIAQTGRPVEWLSPIGFPVLLPYFAMTGSRVKTAFGNLRLRTPDEMNGVNVERQIRATAPGHVHTLDQTHAKLSCLAASRKGIALTPVHDCYASHAATMDQAIGIVLSEYVALHEVDQLGLLHAQWCALYPDIKFPEPPARGSWNVNEALVSQYAFS